MVVRAQAGRVVAAADPAAAVEALQVIEDEGSRTLTEMRQLVAALREGDDADLTPGRGLGDLERLARRDGSSPTVDVQVSGGLDDLGPTVGAAIYRIAQESVTNALRHARRATRVSVRVAGEGDSVRVSIEDDGEAPVGRGQAGFGIVGMTERASLLGGTLVAGPASGRGWVVTATLPRTPAR
jgi:signal transduction histidine kinase